jgi:hypothetical protein
MDMPAVLGLLENVPLLHAEDYVVVYEHAAKLPGTSKFCGCGLCLLLMYLHCFLLGPVSESAVVPPSHALKFLVGAVHGAAGL